LNFLRSSSLIAIACLLLLSSSHSARADQAESIFALTGVGAVGGLLCWVTALNAEPGEGAEPDKAFTRRGPFAGAALSYAVDTFESDAQSTIRNRTKTNVNLSVKNSFGFKGQLGYRCGRYWSAETQVEWLSSFDGKIFQDGVGDAATHDLEPVVVTANGRGYVPLWEDRLQPFGLFGAGLVTVKTKAKDSFGLGLRDSDRVTDAAIRVGGGVDFYATPNIVLTFETGYVQGFGKLNDFDYLSISTGLQYRY
jgi:opacity protein-like surface antigen